MDEPMMTPVKSIADDPARSRRSFWAKTDDLTKADDQKNIFDPKQTILLSLFFYILKQTILVKNSRMKPENSRQLFRIKPDDLRVHFRSGENRDRVKLWYTCVYDVI